MLLYSNYKSTWKYNILHKTSTILLQVNFAISIENES